MRYKVPMQAAGAVALLRAASVYAQSASGSADADASIVPSTFTAPGAFPTSVYSKYYNNPTATSAQVQPVISDPVSHKVYPLELTNPDTIPLNDTVDPHPLPPAASSSRILTEALAQIHSISTNPVFANNTCAQCQATLEVAKFVALAAPEQGPPLFIALCEQLHLSSTCNVTYARIVLGSPVTQVLAGMDAGGYDGQYFCNEFLNQCPLPPTSPLNLTNWFAKPKPNPLPVKKPSGVRRKVLHLSDLHIDPRYDTGSEGNCTSGLCCRSNALNTQSPDTPLLPAPRFGTYQCDSPYALVLAAMEAIPELAGTKDTGFAWSVYTGDLVSHDPENELSRDYTTYTETVVYDLFRRLLGSGPVYATLGNHDSYNQAQDAPLGLGNGLAQQFSWNHDHVASLWAHEHWLPDAAVQFARTHYAAYSVSRQDGLRVISLNTNLWYPPNFFNYINMSSSDPSGILRFLTDELQDAEDAGERVWIIGHVLSGWDGTNTLLNPSNLFYQIVDRFSPHVIANIFWGHTHEDEFSVFYANNGTNMSAQTAGAVSWIAPSLTPLANLNSGFRVYEVDSATFDIVDAHTWKADVNSFPALDNQLQFGPAYAYEYNTRETYGTGIPGWSAEDPLNATWWHLVTEAMEANSSLVDTFNTFEGKTSVKTPACTGDCHAAKICYMRSGSASLAVQNCIPGFGSVQ